MVLLKLAISNFTARRGRLALTLAAVALSVSLVVSVTSGYNSAVAAAYQFLNQYLGSTDAQLSRSQDPAKGIDEALVQQLRDDPDVRRAVGRLESETVLLNKAGQNMGGRPASLFGVLPSEDESTQRLPLLEGQWWAGNDDAPVAVIDQGAREKMGNVHAGEFITLPHPTRPLKLKVVGVVRKPGILADHVQSMYVPLKTLQKFVHPDDPTRVSKISVEFRTDVDAGAFMARWQPRLQSADPLLKLKLTRDSREQLDKNLQGVHVMSYLGGATSMLAATFIVFSTLSMGVAERQRTLAMLRAIGAYRTQIGGLVVVEGLLLSTAGVLVGIPLGLFWVLLLTFRFDELFSAGIHVSWGGVAMAGIGSIAAAVLASLLPAWAAMRVSPLEAMTPLARSSNVIGPLKWAPVGLLLIAIDPLLLFAPIGPWLSAVGLERVAGYAKEITFYGHFVLGLPGVMIGFFLLAPLLVWVVEKVLGPVVAWTFGLRFALLRQQLSGGLWRAAGTCASLMVGLAVLVVMQTQGNTALQGWKLPDKFPDVFIWTQSIGGLDRKAQGQIAGTQGIRRGQVMPIAMFSPQFGGGIFGIAGAAILPDATMFFGLDPELGFDMMQLDFREGSAEETKRMMLNGKRLTLKDGTSFDGEVTEAGNQYLINPLVKKSSAASPATRGAASVPQSVNGLKVAKDQVASIEDGRYLMVTEEFRQLKGYTVGDRFELRSLKKGKLLAYTIAGVVWSPGIDVMVSTFDLGKQFEQRTAASVFGTLKDARDDFGVETVYLLAANLEAGLDKKTLVDRLTQDLGDKGFKVADVRELKHNIQQGFYRLLLVASTVAWAAMAVASLGVTNTIMAGIRSRQWQFGILRSVGVTRSSLLRLVLAEAVLIGIVGSLLGLGAGFAMAVDARELSRLVIGYAPPAVVPWGIVSVGVGVVMAISVLASLYPAIRVARTEPLTLLQAGRASS